MFHPVGHPLERGWVGRVDGDTSRPAGRTDPAVVLHRRRYRARARGVSARGGRAPEPRCCIRPRSGSSTSRTPSCSPIRPLSAAPARRFPERTVWRWRRGSPPSSAPAEFLPRSRSSRSGAIRSEEPPKDRDFALGLGPVAVTAETFEPDACTQLVRVDGLERVRQLSPAFDWHEAVGLAADRTKLYPGDLVAGPSCARRADRSRRHRGGRRRRDRRRSTPSSLRSSYAVPQESSR